MIYCYDATATTTTTTPATTTTTSTTTSTTTTIIYIMYIYMHIHIIYIYAYIYIYISKVKKLLDLVKKQPKTSTLAQDHIYPGLTMAGGTRSIAPQSTQNPINSMNLGTPIGKMVFRNPLFD